MIATIERRDGARFLALGNFRRRNRCGEASFIDDDRFSTRTRHVTLSFYVQNYYMIRSNCNEVYRGLWWVFDYDRYSIKFTDLKETRASKERPSSTSNCTAQRRRYCTLIHIPRHRNTSPNHKHAWRVDERVHMLRHHNVQGFTKAEPELVEGGWALSRG